MVKISKQGITVLKFIVSALLLYLIFTKIDFKEVWWVLRKTHPVYLAVAAILFVVSKIWAAYRLNLYFHQLSILLTQKSNAKLYLLGMFYNLFLPGGIGGDAYKGYIIKKKFEVKTKKVVSVLVLDRLSGLLLLFIYACLLALFINAEIVSGFKIIIILTIMTSIIVFWLVNKKFFNNVLPVFWKSFAYSSWVQLFQLLSVFFILKALQVETGTMTYLFIFLLSSIVSVIPLTIGGIGSREVTFFYGATWLGLEQDISVGISIVFFLITAFVSLWGIVYHFKKPDLEIQETR
ncbi:lysylphosphatidylglycerol synthase transmembrane domain-containing protein [Costertonia aggregata]|uniref:Flippase-like domain-containing protein n=1 Tax=Costertonia aggregata TaxID=343403 RepID=A0A7H9ASD3_9FLAO|nr:lysylphosphatidylglycerol synthase transmembrane domain-containing protein [Costertonia aggregata]QLG46346.1 flippase-like domain-containing protein [Costertonia aggregata]